MAVGMTNACMPDRTHASNVTVSAENLFTMISARSDEDLMQEGCTPSVRMYTSYILQITSDTHLTRQDKIVDTRRGTTKARLVSAALFLPFASLMHVPN